MGNVTQIGQVDVADVAVAVLWHEGPRVVIQSMGNPAMFSMPVCVYTAWDDDLTDVWMFKKV